MKYKSIIWILLFFTGFLPTAKAVEGPAFLKKVCMSDSVVNLLWNRPPDTCFSFVSYRIFARENPTDAFFAIDSLNNYNDNTYSRKLPNNKGTWEFYISVDYACDGVTKLNSNVVQVDRTAPPLTVLDSVSVDLVSQKVVIGWQPNPAVDMKGYRIYLVAGTNITIKDTNSLSYRHPASQPQLGSITYSIAPIDSCDNLAAPDPNPHGTIFLKNSIDSCKGIITLEWTGYKGWTVGNYYVYGDTNNSGNFVLLASVSGTTFTQTVPYRIGSGITYSFYVRAQKSASSITSSSNLSYRYARLIVFPSFNYISTVTVENNKDIRIKWLVDVNAEIWKFYIMKSTDSVNFTPIDSVLNSPIQSNRSYLDPNVNVQTTKYFYRIDAYNECRHLLTRSNISHNIVLSVTLNRELKWTNYSFWPTSIESFVLNRGTDLGSGFTWNVLYISDGVTFGYMDTDPPEETGNTGACYEVIANENSGNPHSSKEISTSNQVCVLFDAIIYFPNAFCPSHKNKTFLPKGAYIDWNKSSIQVFNRWGEQVFESTATNYAWDGKDPNKNDCAEGVYYYKAVIFGLKGDKVNKSGTVMLVR